MYSAAELWNLLAVRHHVTMLLATLPCCGARAVSDGEGVIFKDECTTVCLFQNTDDLTLSPGGSAFKLQTLAVPTDLMFTKRSLANGEVVSQ